jgi:dienelactone hydrolase
MPIKILQILCLVSLLGAQAPEQRRHQHRVTSKNSPAPEPGAEREEIPSLVEGLRGKRDWTHGRRREVERRWLTIVGRVEPRREHRKWFGDIRKARVIEEQQKEGYRRIHLELPMEKDFYQPHLLLVPDGAKKGERRPAVIAWTSSTPDYQMPEQWWGKWLVSRGYIVLTGWSFIRNYRDGTKARTGAAEKVYERFGRWLPMGKMVHDVRREYDYLRSLKMVDKRRVGFMGFSLSAKAAVYVAAFLPQIAATVAVDPHIAVNGGTNWYAPWYLDWTRRWEELPAPEHTVLGLLNPNKARPGFEHDHHELLALAAPRPFLLIGGSLSEDGGGDSDDLQSWGYVNRAKEVYRLLGVADRLEFVLTGDGHKATGPNIDVAWQGFVEKWLGGKTR